MKKESLKKFESVDVDVDALNADLDALLNETQVP